MTKLKKRSFYVSVLGLMVGVPLVVASVPSRTVASNGGGGYNNNTAIYQELHEIKVTKTKAINFDADIAKLSAQEKLHRDVNNLRLQGAAERLQNQKYKPSGS